MWKEHPKSKIHSLLDSFSVMESPYADSLPSVAAVASPGSSDLSVCFCFLSGQSLLKWLSFDNRSNAV